MTCEKNCVPVCSDNKQPVNICDAAKKNSTVITDINAGMDALLELLIGGSRSDSVQPCPACLTDEILCQADNLMEIRDKLSKAMCSLRG